MSFIYYCYLFFRLQFTISIALRPSLVVRPFTQLFGLVLICVFLQYSSEEEEADLQTALTGYQTKQRKVLEPVDHQKIQYEPYRKNFYVEVPELARMTPEGWCHRLK